MKRKSTFLHWFLLLAVIVLGSGMMNGQLLVENFEYTTGSLLTANGWTAHSGAGTQAVDVTAGLVYDGYAGSGIGGAANLDNNGEDVHRTFEAQTSGAVYVATVIQTSSTNSAGYFMHLGQTTIGTTFFTRLWVNATGDGVGIGANAPASYIAISPNTPTLVVLKLDFATKLSSLYVLNAFTATEPEAASQTFTETASFSNIGSVALRQYNAAQRIIVDGIRVATSWAVAVAAGGSSNPTVATPTFSPSTGNYSTPQSVTISTTTEGASIYYTTNGVDPTEASTLVSGPVNVSTTTTLKARAYKSGMDASAVASATYTFPVEVANIAALRSQPTGSAVYKLAGEAVLTLKTATRNAKYIQDATAGILIDDAGGVITPVYNVGDGITGISGTLGTYNGMLQFTPIADPGAATSTNNTVTPISVSLNDLPNYPGQLVKVTGVTIGDVDGGNGTFAVSKNFPLNGTSDRFIRTAYSDLPWIGQSIPSGQQDITGLVLIFSATAQLVPRTISDITATPVAIPTITVSVVDIPAMTAEINQTDAETFTVSAENLTENITLALSGTNANLFSLSTYSITPVSGTVSNVEVTVTYAPLAAGSHSATITLTSAGAANVTRNLTATATNPAVPMPNVIITEVYGGGGNSGATLKNDFIELYNTTEESINLGGWSLQYYSATGTTQSSAANAFFVFPASRFIPAKGHLLIQAAAGSGGTQDFSAPDVISEIALGATGGKIILYSTSLAQTITSDISSITGNEFFKDYVPYGATATPVWGSAMGAVSNTTSATRKFSGGNYVYTQNIGNDFEAVTPNPQNAGISTSVDETRLLPVLVVGSQIRFNANAGERVEVYNAMGQQLYAAPATDGMNVVNLSTRGMLIVKVGELVTKVIM